MGWGNLPHRGGCPASLRHRSIRGARTPAVLVAVPPLRHGRHGNPLQGLILAPSFQPQVSIAFPREKPWSMC